MEKLGPSNTINLFNNFKLQLKWIFAKTEEAQMALLSATKKKNIASSCKVQS